MRDLNIETSPEQIERALLRVQWNRMAEQPDPALRERLGSLSDDELMSLAHEAVAEVRRDSREWQRGRMDPEPAWGVRHASDLRPRRLR